MLLSYHPIRHVLLLTLICGGGARFLPLLVVGVSGEGFLIIIARRWRRENY